jgi:hypothetical protein
MEIRYGLCMMFAARYGVAITEAWKGFELRTGQITAKHRQVWACLHTDKCIGNISSCHVHHRESVRAV